MAHSKNTQIDEWPPDRLEIEMASLLDVPGYILMHDQEKRAAGYPVSQDEMREFIHNRRKADAFLASFTVNT